VFLPESAPWLADYVDELATFPTGSYDDAVDSTTQALNYLRQLVRTPFIFPGSMICDPDEKEMLFQKALDGYPLTQEEIDKL
jgi:hypothetical protein